MYSNNIKHSNQKLYIHSIKGCAIYFYCLSCTEKVYYKISRATIRMRAAFSYLTNYLLFVHLMVDLWCYSAEMMMIFQHATSKPATAIS